MANSRKRHSKEYQAKVAIEAIKGMKTSSEIAAEFGIHPVQISQWKKQLLEGSPNLFEKGTLTETDERDALIERLYQQIGQLQVEVNWLKKKGF